MFKLVFIVESLDVGGTELSLLKWLRRRDRNTFEPSIISFRKGALRKDMEELNVHTAVTIWLAPMDYFPLGDNSGKERKGGHILEFIKAVADGFNGLSHGINDLSQKFLSFDKVFFIERRGDDREIDVAEPGRTAFGIRAV